VLNLSGQQTFYISPETCGSCYCLRFVQGLSSLRTTLSNCDLIALNVKPVILTMVTWDGSKKQLKHTHPSDIVLVNNHMAVYNLFM